MKITEPSRSTREYLRLHQSTTLQLKAELKAQGIASKAARRKAAGRAA